MEKKLFDAIDYSILSSGKRLGPFLVLKSSELFSVEKERALRVAAAIEMVHAYSIVHDDLPSMDDDDLRRGKPTTHKKFNEAIAILTGDSLLTLSFEILSDALTHSDAKIRCELISELSKKNPDQGILSHIQFFFTLPTKDRENSYFDKKKALSAIKAFSWWKDLVIVLIV